MRIGLKKVNFEITSIISENHGITKNHQLNIVNKLIYNKQLKPSETTNRS